MLLLQEACGGAEEEVLPHNSQSGTYQGCGRPRPVQVPPSTRGREGIWGYSAVGLPPSLLLKLFLRGKVILKKKFKIHWSRGNKFWSLAFEVSAVTTNLRSHSRVYLHVFPLNDSFITYSQCWELVWGTSDC